MLEKNLKVIEKYLTEQRVHYDNVMLVLRTGNDNPYYGFIELWRGGDYEYVAEEGGNNLEEVIAKIAEWVHWIEN